jgi:hypothetical protein
MAKTELLLNEMCSRVDDLLAGKIPAPIQVSETKSYKNFLFELEGKKRPNHVFVHTFGLYLGSGSDLTVNVEAVMPSG